MRLRFIRLWMQALAMIHRPLLSTRNLDRNCFTTHEIWGYPLKMKSIRIKLTNANGQIGIPASNGVGKGGFTDGAPTLEIIDANIKLMIVGCML